MRRRVALTGLLVLLGCTDMVGPGDDEYEELCTIFVEAIPFAADPIAEIHRKRTPEQKRRCRNIIVLVLP